jgi:hypothetical protein
MRVLAITAALLLLTGCHDRVHIGSPQFQRAPELCIVVVNDAELAKAAVAACKEITERRGKLL